MILNALCFSYLTTTIFAGNQGSLSRKSILGGCALGFAITIIKHKATNPSSSRNLYQLTTRNLLVNLTDGLTILSIVSIFFRVLDYAAGNMRARSS